MADLAKARRSGPPTSQIHNLNLTDNRASKSLVNVREEAFNFPCVFLTLVHNQLVSIVPYFQRWIIPGTYPKDVLPLLLEVPELVMPTSGMPLDNLCPV